MRQPRRTLRSVTRFARIALVLIAAAVAVWLVGFAAVWLYIEFGFD